MRKTRTEPGQLQNRYQQDERNRKVYDQKVKAPDELRRLCALVSVGGRKTTSRMNIIKIGARARGQAQLPGDAKTPSAMSDPHLGSGLR